MPAIVARAHAAGARVLLDVYHSLGVFPVDVAALDVDFAVGGSYKYLRGGPGACFLYVHPRHLDAGMRTLDTGWFAKEDPFDYAAARSAALRAPAATRGSNRRPRCCRSTRRAPGSCSRRRSASRACARIRCNCSGGSSRCSPCRASRHRAATEDRGAFVAIRHREARAWSAALKARGVVTDARGEWLRLCPDVLTTDTELVRAARELASVAESSR